MNHSESTSHNNSGIQKITAIKLVKDSYAYGLTNFYKVGIVWWFFIAIDVVVTMYWEIWTDDISESGASPFLFDSVSFGILSLISLPATIIGLNYYNQGRGNLNNIISDLLRLFYVISCTFLVFAIVVPGMIIVEFLISTDRILFAVVGGAIGMLAIIYLACRLFPIIYVAFDKRIGPINSLTHSLKITSGHLVPIFSLIIFMLLIEILFDLLHLGILSDFVITPIEYLALIYAYKQLESYYTHSAQTSDMTRPLA